MKPVHALVACSLLGSIWLASCSDDSTKKPRAAGGEAGEAGEPSPAAGKGGQSVGGTGGANTAGEAAAGQPDATGGASTGGASVGGQGGEGGVAPACFANLNDLSAGATGLGEAGAGNTKHVFYTCDTLMASLAPKYDTETGNITLDSTKLGPVASGNFTFYYNYNDPDGGVSGYNCADAAVQVNGTQLVLPLGIPHTLTSIELPLLQLEDQCGGDAILSTPGANGTCFNLNFSSDTSGDAGVVWNIDCYEGSCETTCADQPG